MTNIEFDFPKAPAVSDPACECPEYAPHPEYCFECPIHGEAAALELDRQHQDEIAAENAFVCWDDCYDASAFDFDFYRGT